MVLAGTTNTATVLRRTFSEAEHGDSLLIYCPASECHEAALQALGVGASEKGKLMKDAREGFIRSLPDRKRTVAT